jgi:hypothetical protein
LLEDKAESLTVSFILQFMFMTLMTNVPGIKFCINKLDRWKLSSSTMWSHVIPLPGYMMRVTSRVGEVLQLSRAAESKGQQKNILNAENWVSVLNIFWIIGTNKRKLKKIVIFF